jgi:hypothetical protein
MVRDSHRTSCHQAAGALVCLSIVLATSSPRLRSSQSEAKNLQAVEVTLLELADHPESYNNRLVRVRGALTTGFERCTLDYYDPDTHKELASIWVDFQDDDSVAKEYRDKYHLDDFMKDAREGRFKNGEPNLPWIIPIPVNPVAPEEERAISKAIKRSHGRPVYVAIDGRFDYTPGGRLICSPGGRLSFTGGFGHMSRYGCRIVVESIRRVKKGK